MRYCFVFLLIIFFNLSCRVHVGLTFFESLKSQPTDVLCFDTLRSDIEVFLYPSGPEPFFSDYAIYSVFDSVFECYSKGTIYKVLEINLSERIVSQTVFDSVGQRNCTGQYVLDSKYSYGVERVISSTGRKTDTLLVYKYIEGFRDGEWIYFDSSGSNIRSVFWSVGDKLE